MKRGWKFSTVAAGVLVMLTASAALAYLTAIGSGTTSATVDTLPSPVVTVPVTATNTVHVAWTAATSPSGNAADVSYLVARSGDGGANWVAANNTCLGTLPGSTLSCDDQPSASGTYIYRVTASFRTWTSSGTSGSVAFSANTPTKLVFTTSAQTLTAGVSSGTITVQRQNAAGVPVTTGSTTVTLSSNAATGIFRDGADATTITSVSIVNGTSTANFRYRDTLVGTPTITAASSGLTPATQQETVNPATAASLVLAAASTTPAAGAADNLTITAKDAYGNVATGYTGAKNLTFGGAGTVGTSTPTVSNSSGTSINFGSTTAITFTNGVASVSGANNGVMKLYKAETAGISLSDGTISNSGNLLSVTVSAGAAARLAWVNVTVPVGTVVSPCLFTCTVNAIGNNNNFTANVAVTDSFGNTVSNLGSGHTVTVSTPTSGSGSGGAFTAPSAGTSVTLTIASTGAAVSTQTFTFKSQNGSWTSNTFSAATASGTVYTGASATVFKQ